MGAETFHAIRHFITFGKWNKYSYRMKDIAHEPKLSSNKFVRVLNGWWQTPLVSSAWISARLLRIAWFVNFNFIYFQITHLQHQLFSKETDEKSFPKEMLKIWSLKSRKLKHLGIQTREFLRKTMRRSSQHRYQARISDWRSDVIKPISHESTVSLLEANVKFSSTFCL